MRWDCFVLVPRPRNDGGMRKIKVMFGGKAAKHHPLLMRSPSLRSRRTSGEAIPIKLAARLYDPDVRRGKQSLFNNHGNGKRWLHIHFNQ